MDLTIVTRGPSWTECPFHTKELWGDLTCLVHPGMEDKPYTKLFAFDGLVKVKGGITMDNDILIQSLEIAKERNIPVVSNQPYATEPFPVVDVVREFRSSYFMNTVSYMLAYALFLKYDKMSVSAIDAGPQWEYQSGKSHVCFWLGVATGRGVDLRVGRGSLRWAYTLGYSELPEAFFIKEGIRMVHFDGTIDGHHVITDTMVQR